MDTSVSKVAYPPLIQIAGREAKPPYGFTPANAHQMEYLQAAEENVFLWGDRGGGKSVTARWHFHSLALANPGYRYAVLRTSFPELTKNHLIYLKAEMEALGGSFHGTSYQARYPNGSLGLYMQAETEDQVRNALGAELHAVCFDEAPTFKWEHMMMIAASVRVSPDSGLVPIKRYLGNPIGPCIDELFAFCVDKDVDLVENPGYRPDEWRSIKISVQDNPHLDVEAYRKQLGVGLPEHIRKAWLDGERTDVRALFELKPTIIVSTVDEATNTMVDTKQPYHIIEELPQYPDSNGRLSSVLEQPWVRILGGYDDGFIDPAVMLWFAVVGQQVICFNERIWTRTNSVEIAKDALAASVIHRPNGTAYQLPLATIYSDPTIGKQTTAVQSTMEVMQGVWMCLEHGVGTKRCCGKVRSLSFEMSTNSRELYASAIHRLMQTEVAPHTPKIQFLRPDPNTTAGKDLIARGIIGCPYLLKALPKMMFDLHNPQKMADHAHDHPVCALAYYAMSYPLTTAPRAGSMRPAWWDTYFVGGSNVPRKQHAAVTRRRR